MAVLLVCLAIVVAGVYQAGREVLLVRSINSLTQGDTPELSRQPDGVVQDVRSGGSVLTWHGKLTGFMSVVTLDARGRVLRVSTLHLPGKGDEYPSYWALRLAVLGAMVLFVVQLQRLRRGAR